MIDGIKLRNLRKSKGLSQVQVANDAQISQTLLSRLEHGQNDTTLSVASGLARALGVEVIELFAEEETNPTMPQPLKA